MTHETVVEALRETVAAAIYDDDGWGPTWADALVAEEEDVYDFVATYRSNADAALARLLAPENRETVLHAIVGVHGLDETLATLGMEQVGWLNPEARHEWVPYSRHYNENAAALGWQPVYVYRGRPAAHESASGQGNR